MRFKYSVLLAACLFVTFTLVAWSVWSASVTAQGVAPPTPPVRVGVNPQALPPDSRQNKSGRSEIIPSQQQVPVLDTTIGRPAGSQQYYYPAPLDPGPPMPHVVYGYRAPATADAKTLELITAYQKQQGEVNQLVKAYGDAKTEDDKNSIRDEIVKATSVQFELRQQIREREVDQLKKRLADVESIVQKRNAVKVQIVEKRVADILREPDQLQWEPFGTASNGAEIFPVPTGIVPTRGVPTGKPLRQSPTQLLGQRGKDINGSELKSLEAELDLAKLIQARTQVEYEGRTKLLALDVRQAESVYDQALAAFSETQEINKRVPNSFPSTQVARQKAAVEQARIELERAKTILEIHQKANAPQDETSSVPRR